MIFRLRVVLEKRVQESYGFGDVEEAPWNTHNTTLVKEMRRGTQNGSPVKKLRDKHLEDSKYASLSKTFIHNVNDATSVGNAFWDTQN